MHQYGVPLVLQRKGFDFETGVPFVSKVGKIMGNINVTEGIYTPLSVYKSRVGYSILC